MHFTADVVSSNQLRRGVLDTTLCDKVCQLLATGRWFSLVTPVSSINKTDRHNIAEILLKVALNTINQTIQLQLSPIFSESVIHQYLKTVNHKMVLMLKVIGDLYLTLNLIMT